MVSNEVKQTIFKAIPNISNKKDSSGVLPMIPPNVLRVKYFIKCYNFKIGSIGDMEIWEAYNRLCENGVLKEEFKIVEKKG